MSDPRKAQPDIASLPRKAQPDIAGLPALATIVDRLAQHATERPEAPAFTFAGGETFDFGTLHARVLAAAQALAANGVGQGDVVALVLKTSPELVVAILATQRLRAVPMVINPSLPEAAIARRVALVAATLVVTPSG